MGQTKQVLLLPVSSISPNPQQPRKVFEEEQLEDLQPPSNSTDHSAFDRDCC
jgi:hypothetical protein